MSNKSMMDDRALVSNILAGNMQAFRLLITQHERLVAHMIGRVVKNKEEVEELCQDVFLKVFDKISEFHFKSKLSTWIATIAYRQAINQVRKNKISLEDKIVLTLFHVEGMNYQEIGEITGMPEGTVKSYLFRARNLLKEKVKHHLSKDEIL